MDESKFLAFACSPFTGNSAAAIAARAQDPKEREIAQQIAKLKHVRPDELKGLFVREMMNVRSEFRDSLSAITSRIQEDMLRVQGTVLDNSRTDNKSLKAEMLVLVANACVDLESRLAPELSKVPDLERELAKVKRAYDSLEQRFSAECTARARQASDMNGMLKRLETLEARRQDQTSAEMEKLGEKIEHTLSQIRHLTDAFVKQCSSTEAQFSGYRSEMQGIKDILKEFKILRSSLAQMLS